jgi:hypothetical protein
MRRRELQWKARITSFVRQILRAKINFLLGQRDYLTSTTQTKSQKVKKIMDAGVGEMVKGYLSLPIKTTQPNYNQE